MHTVSEQKDSSSGKCAIHFGNHVYKHFGNIIRALKRSAIVNCMFFNNLNTTVKSFVQIDNSHVGIEHVSGIGSQRKIETARNVLILCDFRSRHIGTVRDHLEAFRKYSINKICFADVRSSFILKADFRIFDAVVLHYSIVISSESYVSLSMAQKIREFNGYKILFIQDEYRWVDRTVAAIADLGVDLIYSVINKEAISLVYHHPSISHVRRKETLTGFVPENLTKLPVPSYCERKFDVGYRARKVPAWLGAFAQEKWRIGEQFKKDAGGYGLILDIEHNESKRLYGEKWVSFMSNCKAMLGTESGASVIDFSGKVQQSIEAYERDNPDADFQEISDRFLKSRDGEVVIHVISPRCFEAAALRTLMILYPGTYSGVLEPWRHYVPLNRDHSNIEEVVAILRNQKRAKQIIDNAYHEVALNPRFSFKTMVEEFDSDLIENTWDKAFDATKNQRGQNASGLPDRTDTVLKKLNQLIEREYAKKRILQKLRNIIEGSIYWAIETFVPKKWQNTTLITIKKIFMRMGPFKKS